MTVQNSDRMDGVQCAPPVLGGRKEPVNECAQKASRFPLRCIRLNRCLSACHSSQMEIPKWEESFSQDVLLIVNRLRVSTQWAAVCKSIRFIWLHCAMPSPQSGSWAANNKQYEDNNGRSTKTENYENTKRAIKTAAVKFLIITAAGVIKTPKITSTHANNSHKKQQPLDLEGEFTRQGSLRTVARAGKTEVCSADMKSGS